MTVAASQLIDIFVGMLCCALIAFLRAAGLLCCRTVVFPGERLPMANVVFVTLASAWICGLCAGIALPFWFAVLWLRVVGLRAADDKHGQCMERGHLSPAKVPGVCVLWGCIIGAWSEGVLPQRGAVPRRVCTVGACRPASALFRNSQHNVYEWRHGRLGIVCAC